MNIQRFMVALVFLAIVFWAGPVLLPEAVRRWNVCYRKAAYYQAEARSWHAEAIRRAVRSLPDEGRMTREVAEHYARAARRYRRSLVIPWDFWSLGGYFPSENWELPSPRPPGRPGFRGKPR